VSQLKVEQSVFCETGLVDNGKNSCMPKVSQGTNKFKIA